MLHEVPPGFRRFALVAVALAAVVIGLFAFTSSAFAADLVVNPDTGCSDIAPSPQYCHIQAAIDAAAPGDTIHIYPATYDETAANRTLYNGSGLYQFGLFIAKDDLTLQGVSTGGAAINDPADAAAQINTNATNNFGASGIFVQADNVTIDGLMIGPNSPSDNKSIEVIGDNFTFRDSVLNVPGGGALYIDDWRYTASPLYCKVNSYTVTHNLFRMGGLVSVASGPGACGTGTRLITDNVFEADPTQTWPFVSFNSSGTTIAWYVYPVGPATVSGNTFAFTDQYVRWRGDEPSLNWAATLGANTFPHAVQVTDPSGAVRPYGYNLPTFPEVRRIASILWPAQYVAGDTVTFKSDSQAAIYVDPTVHTLNSGETEINVPVYFNQATNTYGGVQFTLDYDQSCLNLNAGDANSDGIPDGVLLNSAFPGAIDHAEVDAVNGTLAIGMVDDDTPIDLPNGATKMFDLHFSIAGNCQTDNTFPVLMASSAPINCGGVLGDEVACFGVGAQVPVDFNANPSAPALSPLTIPENAAYNGVLSATDPDLDALTFSKSSACSNGGANNDLFTLNGSALTANPFNFEQMVANPLKVCIAVADPRGGSALAGFDVTVTNVNEPPASVALSQNEFAQSKTTANQPLADFQIVGDPDAPGAFPAYTCAITAQGPGTPFVVSGLHLLVSGSDLAAGVYHVQVHCTDLANPIDSPDFQITIYGWAALALHTDEWHDNVARKNGPDTLDIPVDYAPDNNVATLLEFSVSDSTGLCLELQSASGAGVSLIAGAPKVVRVVNPSTTPAVIATLHFKALGSCPDNRTGAGMTGAMRTEVELEPTVTAFRKGTLDLDIIAGGGFANVIDNSRSGDCNASDPLNAAGAVNAADYVATVLEQFDNDQSAADWLAAPTDEYDGSPFGCDSNRSAVVDVADIVCTVKISFNKVACIGDSIHPASLAATELSVAADPMMTRGGAVDVPLVFDAKGTQVGALVFALKLDPAKVGFSPADANADGIPDAIKLNLAASQAGVVKWDAAANTLKVAVFGVVDPLPALNGLVATLTLQGVSDGAAGLAFVEASAATVEGENAVVVSHVGPNNFYSFRTFLPVLNK